MKKFLILFKTPIAIIDAWKAKPAEETKAENEKTMTDWNVWMAIHKENVSETAGAGKTKLVSKDGISDIRNDIMLYCMATAIDHEAATKIFEKHPHLAISESSIEIMEVNYTPEMK